MTRDAWEMWLLTMEKTQRIIYQLQYDPDLTGMMGSPTDNPYEIQIGPSGLELIDINEIVVLDDLEITTSQVGSPMGVSAQPETVEASQRTYTSNPLSEFIRIYDEDESLEESLGTHVHVEEEKGPEKTSSPEPKVKTKEVLQKET